MSGCTLPPHGGVENYVIAVADQPSPEGSSSGFVITYIPKSTRAPHQCIHGKPYYYMRAGSSFLPVPHGVLAGMFGQAPTPEVCLKFEADLYWCELEHFQRVHR